MTLVAQIEGTGTGRPAAVSVPSLGRNADFVANPDSQELAKVVLPDPKTQISLAQVRGWHLRSVARQILKTAGVHKRLRWCGEKISFRDRGVSVFRRPDRATGRLSGVCVCGQSICCPVCAPRIAAFRAAEISDAYQRARDAGFEAYLDTHTIPHVAAHDLGHEVDTFATAWRAFMQARTSRSLYSGQLGNHVAREMTYGVNGWHFHHHALRYYKPGTHNPDLAKAQWLSALQSVERWTPDAIDYSYDSRPVTDAQGATYTAKIAIAVEASARTAGLEIAMSSAKGRNIISLLADHDAGSLTAGPVWLEGTKAIIRRKVSSVRWSPGLRDKLGLGTAEKTDEEIAAEKAERTDELLGILTTVQWRAIINARAEWVLVRAAQAGRDSVNTFLDGLGIGELQDELPEAKSGKL